MHSLAPLQAYREGFEIFMNLSVLFKKSCGIKSSSRVEIIWVLLVSVLDQ